MVYATRALRALFLDAADDVRIRAVLGRGNPPKGDIWSYERGLES